MIEEQEWVELSELSKPSFGLLPQQYVPAVWHQVQPLLLEHGKQWLEVYSIEEVFDVLSKGFGDLWLAGESGIVAGVVVAAWERHAKASYYHVLFCGGSGLDTYLSSGLETLERYACMGGAKEVIVEGRWGWQRKLRKQGYVQTSVKLRKAVKVLWSN